MYFQGTDTQPDKSHTAYLRQHGAVTSGRVGLSERNKHLRRLKAPTKAETLRQYGANTSLLAGICSRNCKDEKY